MKELSVYPVIHQQTVAWGDMDAFGHVNNAVFASYYEMARVAYFDQVLGERVNWNQTGMILAKAGKKLYAATKAIDPASPPTM